MRFLRRLKELPGRIRREAFRFARAMALFVIPAVLVLVLHPDFLPELSSYLSAPGRRGALRPSSFFSARTDDSDPWPAAVPFMRLRDLHSDRPWTWDRLLEVAQGRRAFDRADEETFRRQAKGIGTFLDWFVQPPEWRRPKYVRWGDKGPYHVNLRGLIDVAEGLAFHLDGLDAHGDRDRWLEVVEAAFSYIEDVSDTGLSNHKNLWAIAQICQDRIFRQVLRHLERVPHGAADMDRLAARLALNLERVGDLRQALRRELCYAHNTLLMTEPDAQWPEAISTREHPRRVWLDEAYRELMAREKSVLNEALGEEPRRGLARVVSHELKQVSERQVPLPAKTRLIGLLIGDWRVLFRAHDPAHADQVFVREMEWSALRRGTLVTVRMLARRAHGEALPKTPIELALAIEPAACVDPFSGGLIGYEPSGDGFRVFMSGRDGVLAGGAGDDVAIWPVRARTVIAQQKLPEWGLSPFDRERRPAPKPAPPERAFTGPARALRAALAEAVELDLKWDVIAVARPESAEALGRAEVTVVAAERFHRLGALLVRPGLAAIGGRGELVNGANGRRELHCDVALGGPAAAAPSPSAAPRPDLVQRVGRLLREHGVTIESLALEKPDLKIAVPGAARPALVARLAAADAKTLAAAAAVLESSGLPARRLTLVRTGARSWLTIRLE